MRTTHSRNTTTTTTKKSEENFECDRPMWKLEIMLLLVRQNIIKSSCRKCNRMHLVKEVGDMDNNNNKNKTRSKVRLNIGKVPIFV